MFQPIFISEGFRFWMHSLRVRKHGYNKYKGSASEILKQIIDNCWNQDREFFMTATGHYTQFWTRDFGMCCEHLINLGHKEKVMKTLKYALSRFKKYHKITTSITPGGKPYDFPVYAPDSLAHLTHSLVLLQDKNLIDEYRSFLNQEIVRFFDLVIDSETGLVKKSAHFSSMKDYSIRSSSCYDNCMVSMLKNNCNLLGLDNPFLLYDYRLLIKKYFWKGDHFIDDISGNDSITGDAQVFPFYCSVFDDRHMFEQCVRTLSRNKLDNPFPLRYYHRKAKEHDMIWIDFLAGGWEHDNVWPMLAMPFFACLKRFNHPALAKYLHQYKKVIEQYKTFLEVFNQDGKPLKTFFYCADEGMLWSAIILDIMKQS